MLHIIWTILYGVCNMMCILLVKASLNGPAEITKVLIRLMLKKCSRSNSWWFGFLGDLLYCGEMLTRYG